MPIISQIGVIVLIVCTIFIIVKSNKSLADAVTEGEHFVDEWEVRTRIKQELALEREAYERAGKMMTVKDHEQTVKMLDHFEEEGSKEESVSRMPETLIPQKKTVPDQYITVSCLDDYGSRISEVRVDHYPFLIGRDEDNDLVLHDLCVGKKHCQIEGMGGEVWLKDLGSANKLYANGKVYEELMLVNGMTVCVGNQELKVAIGG